MTRNGSLPSTVEGTGISQASGDARYAQLGAANVFSPSAQSFPAGVNLGYQSFTENGSTMGTISLSGGTIVEVLGSTGSSILQLPSAPPTGTVFCIIISATSGITLSGSVSGKTIGGVAGIGVSPGQSFWIGFNGTGWVYLSLPPQVATSITGALGFTNACSHSGAETHTGSEVFSGNCTHSGSESFSGVLNATAKFVRTPQTFNASGTISATAGSLVNFTGSAGQTLTLPLSPGTSGMQITVKDESGNGVTVNPNTKNVDGSGSNLTLSAYGTVTIYWNGSAWFTI